jgi:phage FluMu protein Com
MLFRRPQPAQPTTKTVQCLHCERWIEVSTSAITLTCPRCYQRLRVDDIVIQGEVSVGSLRTCGCLLIARRSVLRAQTVEARGGVQVLGRLAAKSVSGRSVRIGPKASFEGDCRAEAITIDPTAAVLAGRFEIRPPTPGPEGRGGPGLEGSGAVVVRGRSGVRQTG